MCRQIHLHNIYMIFFLVLKLEAVTTDEELLKFNPYKYKKTYIEVTSP